MSLAQTLTRSDVQLHTGVDPSRVAHYVRKERITEAIVEGMPVTALCGYVWVPSRSPESLPVCQACKADFDERPAA